MAEETPRHRRAFDLYTKLRSTRKVAPVIGVHEVTVRQWSRMFGWQERLREHDSQLSKSAEAAKRQKAEAKAPKTESTPAIGPSIGESAPAPPPPQKTGDGNTSPTDLRVVEGLLARSVRDLATRKSPSIKASCPKCSARFDAKVPWTVADTKTNVGDVERLMRLKWQLEGGGPGSGGEDAEYRDERSTTEVARSLVNHLERLGGLNHMIGLYLDAQPDD